MKEKLKDIKRKAIMLWWLITHRNFYVLSFNVRKEGILESYNIELPQFCEWLKVKHGYMTHEEIIQSLKNMAFLTDDFLTKKQLVDLINKLKEEYK